jgi:hypothetical protein
MLKMPLYNFIQIVELSCLCLLISGCGNGAKEPPKPDEVASDYKSAKTTLLKELASVKSFHALYPDAHGFFTHFAEDSPGPLKWTSRTVVYERYILTLTIDVAFSEEYSTVKLRSPLSFTLREITELKARDGDSISLAFGMSKEFGAAKWEEIKRHEGDIEKVFRGIRTNKPIAEIDKVIDSLLGPSG